MPTLKKANQKINNLRDLKQNNNIDPSRKKTLQKRIDLIRNNKEKEPSNQINKKPAFKVDKPNNTENNKIDNKGINNNALKGGELTGDTPDPRDDKYWLDIARLDFNKSQTLQELSTDEIFSRTSYEDSISSLNRNTKDDILSTKQNANRGGALYSSATGEALGKVEQGSILQRSGLDRNYQAANAARELSRQGIHGGYLIDNQNELADATYRQAALEMTRPSPISPNISGELGKNNKNRIDDIKKKINNATPEQKKKLQKQLSKLKNSKKKKQNGKK